MKRIAASPSARCRITALAKLMQVVDGEEQPIGREAAEDIRHCTGCTEDA